jgi:hypothetical protein
MTSEQNRELVQRFIDAVINGRGDLGEAGEVCVSDFVWHSEDRGDFRSLEAFRKHVMPGLGARPELSVVVEETLVLGDYVFCRYVWCVTERDAGSGAVVTRRASVPDGLAMYRIAGNRLVEAWWQTASEELHHPLVHVPLGIAA